MTTEREGVIKYELRFTQKSQSFDAALLDKLNRCRIQLREAQMLGIDQTRYGGLGFGNLSLRSIDHHTLCIVSGSQTGHLDRLQSHDIARVTGFDVRENRLCAEGTTQPSSEAMTHAVLYQVSKAFNAVVHVHSPAIWRHSDQLGLPFTEQSIPYGTPAMADAVTELARKNDDRFDPLVFVMKGHEDGVVAAGSSIERCTEALLLMQQGAAQK